VNMGLSFCPVPVAAQLSTFYREQANKAGWDPTADNMLYRGFIHVAETDQKAMEEVAYTYWQVPTTGANPAASHSVPGTSGGGTATAVAPAEMDIKKALSADQFKSMGLQFCGSPDSVFEQIRQLKNETGVGIIDFVFQGISLPHDMLLHSMELFGKEVLPRMHEL
jgi:alkanesulfonate monooxygenase SsuD/methylene tetrahydromethanopterin reductase-like flavin-dependent oxidoreductase (luciferase family)